MIKLSMMITTHKIDIFAKLDSYNYKRNSMREEKLSDRNKKGLVFFTFKGHTISDEYMLLFHCTMQLIVW